MKYDCIIGIDPGGNGGIATWRDDKVEVRKMPRDYREIRTYCEYIRSVAEKPIVFIEKLQLRKDDFEGGKAFGIQKMLANYQRLKDMVEIAGIPFVLVHPMTWQSKLALNQQRGLEKAERKAIYKERAQALFPAVKVTLWNADALLILRFAQLVAENNPGWIYGNLKRTGNEELF